MSNSVKRFAFSSAVYFVGNVLSRVSLFLMVPLYTKYLSPADYGYYDVSLACLSIFTSALFLDIWATVLRFMYDESGRDKYKALCNGVCIMAVSFLCYGIIAGIIAWQFSIPSFSWIVVYGFFLCWQNFYAHAARGLGESTLFAFSGIVNTFITIAINVIMIVKYGYGYNSLYIAAIAGMLVQIFMLEYRIKLLSGFQFAYIQLSSIREMFYYSLPLAINSVCYWLLTDYNRIVILKYLGLSSNGVYAIASKFAMALMLFSSCFTLAWQETAFAKAGEQQTDCGEFYSNAGTVFMKFLLCGGIVLFPIISTVFPFMVDQTYQEARIIIPLYLLAIMANIYNLFLGNIFAALKQTKVIFISTVGACLTNIIVIHSTIDIWGLQAASLALLAGYLVNIAIRVYLLQSRVKFFIVKKAFFSIFPLLVLTIAAYLELTYHLNIMLIPISLMMVFLLLKKEIFLIITKIRSQRT